MSEGNGKTNGRRPKPKPKPPVRVPDFVRWPKMRERLMEALEAGNYRRASALYAGTQPATLESWITRGRAERDEGLDTPYVQLLMDVEKAEAGAEVFAVAVVRRAMTDQWAPAMTFLERKFPHQWGRRTIVEGGDKPIGLVAG